MRHKAEALSSHISHRHCEPIFCVPPTTGCQRSVYRRVEHQRVPRIRLFATRTSHLFKARCPAKKPSHVDSVTGKEVACSFLRPPYRSNFRSACWDVQFVTVRSFGMYCFAPGFVFCVFVSNIRLWLVRSVPKGDPTTRLSWQASQVHTGLAPTGPPVTNLSRDNPTPQVGL